MSPKPRCGPEGVVAEAVLATEAGMVVSAAPELSEATEGVAVVGAAGAGAALVVAAVLVDAGGVVATVGGIGVGVGLGYGRNSMSER
jgi:hypothetical protein